nr:hypothetical protein [Tanacetum cinerariifolium]
MGFLLFLLYKYPSPHKVKGVVGLFITMLIIYHLQRKHKFHLRPDSPLHLPNEEPVLGYLKFSATGNKERSLWDAYSWSDPDSPAPKPTKIAKKSKPTMPKADPRPPVLNQLHLNNLNPNPNRPRLRERSASCSLRTVDESVAEDIPEKEPKVDDEEADVQRALEESLKSMYDVSRGPLPPVVIREPESGKYQPLLEVPGKGKEKVTKEQVAHGLLTLQTPKKKSPADRYILQRHTSTPTGSFGTDVGVQGAGQAGPNPNAQDEGQSG